MRHKLAIADRRRDFARFALERAIASGTMRSSAQRRNMRNGASGPSYYASIEFAAMALAQPYRSVERGTVQERAQQPARWRLLVIEGSAHAEQRGAAARVPYRRCPTRLNWKPAPHGQLRPAGQHQRQDSAARATSYPSALRPRRPIAGRTRAFSAPTTLLACATGLILRS